jgi:lipoprotein NlpI|tara:strand:- start:447 stop:794 length:348 start_codon:yes stop_codon:yes gene_type:complete
MNKTILLFLLFLFIPFTSYSQTLSDTDAKTQVDRYLRAQSSFRLGQLYFEDEIFNNAIVDFTKSIKLNPEHADSFYYRGLAKDDIGYNNGTCSDCESASSLGNIDASELVREKCD